MRQNGSEEDGSGDDGDDGSGGDDDASNIGGGDDDKIAVPVEHQRPSYKADTLLLLS
jgi:hypothetical protein